MLRRPIIWAAGLTGAVLAAGAAVWPTERGQRLIRDTTRTTAKRLRYWSHVLEGVSHQLEHGQPDPDVPDTVVADRVRSELGRLLKLLDLPRIHVEVVDHVATLHGAVDDEVEARMIETATAQISGVEGVESYLTIGLGKGLTRPSEGHEHPPTSDAYRQLLGAATGAGLDEEMALPVVRAVLSTFCHRIPEGEAQHLLDHLPEDARALVLPPRLRGEAPSRLRTVPELVDAVMDAIAAQSPHQVPEVGPVVAERVAERVLGTLRQLVPEEVVDVGAVLPEDLRDLWYFAPAG